MTQGKENDAPERDGGCDATDFVNGVTWEWLNREVRADLDLAARGEFETILGDCDVREGDLVEIDTQAALIKKWLCAYVDGLAAQYKTYGAAFFGDGSAKEMANTELGCKGD